MPGILSVGGLLGGRNSGFYPSVLFTSGSPGVWFDPSDFNTMFQDSLGATPVTAATQPVGLILDKSKGLALGAQLISNTGFDSDTVWTKGTGWVISGGVASRPPQAAASSLTQSVTLTAGVTYQVTYTLVTIPAGNMRARFTGGTAVDGTQRSAPGTYTEYLTAVTGNNIFAISANTAGTDLSVDNVSVREIAGNHASQATSAARPILQQDASGRFYLDFDGTDDTLATSAIDFTATDSMTVFAGLRKLTAVGTATMFMETSVSSGANNGTIAIQAPETAQQYRFRSRGTTFSDAQTASGSFAAPITNVVTSISDISADVATLRINGADAATSATDQGTGNYTSQPLYIGARAGTSLFFTGRLYSLIVLGRTATASEIASTEAWVNGKTGAY